MKKILLGAFIISFLTGCEAGSSLESSGFFNSSI